MSQQHKKPQNNDLSMYQLNCIGGVKISVLASSLVEHGIKP